MRCDTYFPNYFFEKVLVVRNIFIIFAIRKIRRTDEFRITCRTYQSGAGRGTEIGTYLHNNSLGVLDASGNSIWQSATAKLQTPENQSNEIWQSAITKLEEWSTPADWLFNKLNYTSLAYLTSIEDPLKRAFYEQETIRGCWTVRELDRQVSSQYYERMGLSKDKKALQKLAVKNGQIDYWRQCPRQRSPALYHQRQQYGLTLKVQNISTV